MAYGLYIERDDKIDLEEWNRTVESISGVKIDVSNIEIVNPNTGEKLSFPGSEGNVSVLFESRGLFGFGKKSEWEISIQFMNGKGSFNFREALEMPTNAMRIAVSKISNSLGARIVGEEGETYVW